VVQLDTRIAAQADLVDIGAYRRHFAMSIEYFRGIRSAVLIEPTEELASGLRTEFDKKIYRVPSRSGAQISQIS